MSPHVPHRHCLRVAVLSVSVVAVLERHADDEFIALCCDGIWDVMSNEAVVEHVRAGAATKPLQDVAASLLDKCLALNSRDNMTACLVAMPGAKLYVTIFGVCVPCLSRACAC